MVWKPSSIDFCCLFWITQKTFLWEKQMCHLVSAEDNDKSSEKKSNYFWWMCNWGTSSLCQLPCDLPHPAVITSFQLETEPPQHAFLHLPAIFFLISDPFLLGFCFPPKLCYLKPGKKMKFATALLSHSSWENNMNPLRGLGGNKELQFLWVNTCRGHVQLPHRTV